MLRLARSDAAPGVVADQYGQPTWTADVAAKIYDLVGLARPGRHLSRDQFGPDHVVWLAEEIFRLHHAMESRNREAERGRLTPRPLTTAEYPTPARRPAYSVLGHAAWPAAGIAPIGDWKDALHRAFPAVAAA